MAVIARVSSGYNGASTDARLTAPRQNQEKRARVCTCDGAAGETLSGSRFLIRSEGSLVSCLYFSTLASLHFDHCHELHLGSITSSSQQIQASVLFFISAKPVFFPSLDSENTFMLAQIIVSTSSRAPRGSHFTAELSQAAVLLVPVPG